MVDGQQVILYELNEVPWAIVDLYVERRPRSHTAWLVRTGLSRTTTVADDPVPLQPWRTWPTFHRSMYADEHGSLDLGQDPATTTGVDLWDAAADAGLRVGLVGPLQSWPARRFPGGFHVPDTFARTPDTDPPQLRRFQALNLAMTAENGFASDAALPVAEIAGAGAGLLRRGLAPRSVADVGRHLVRERRDRRYTAGRPMMQVLPSFDVYWWLHRRHRPHLSVFFTNHVAAMMHRYWGDAVPGYGDGAGGEPYAPDPVYARFVLEAMDLFDRQLGRIRRWLDGAGRGAVLVVASSMGQGPIPYRHMADTYVLDDADRLAAALGLAGADAGLAMYPRSCLQLPTAAEAAGAAEVLASVHAGDEQLFSDLRVHGTTVSFQIAYRFGAEQLDPAVRWVPAGGDAAAPRTGTIADLGVVARARPGGGNTAYHIPEGILLATGGGVRADGDRRQVSILDAAPSILRLLGVEPPPSMRGVPTVFT
jgi:hypothetical protein